MTTTVQILGICNEWNILIIKQTLTHFYLHNRHLFFFVHFQRGNSSVYFHWAWFSNNLRTCNLGTNDAAEWGCLNFGAWFHLLLSGRLLLPQLLLLSSILAEYFTVWIWQAARWGLETQSQHFYTNPLWEDDRIMALIKTCSLWQV